jgi:hypothetical protein
MGQDAPATVELRRFLECVFWCVYFSDHSVEWLDFESDPGRSIEPEVSKPISYNTHREPTFYRNYARERFLSEPSELAKQAVDELNVQYASLSAAAHGSSSVKHGRLIPPLTNFWEAELGRFAETYRTVASAGAITLAAFCRAQFDSLPPAYRGWFDWLVGGERAKKIRGGPFGLTC